MKLTTRYLMTCAAIGAAGGILLVPTNHLAAVLAPIAPIAYGALVGVWMLPVVIALALIRRPLAGILTSLIAGLINIPLTPYGASAVVTTLMVGVAMEIFLALGLYRVWATWLFQLAALLLGSLYAWSAWAAFGLATVPAWAQVLFVVVLLASVCGFTALGIVVARRLERAGVARGLAPKRRALVA
jgi:energy-coupling factor transport system substrate-specific component